MNGFQRDLIKAAKALAYAHRATEGMDKESPDFPLAVWSVANSIHNLNDAVEALEEYEKSKKHGTN